MYGICDESEFNCSFESDFSSCTISADNATRTSYLIEKCSFELTQAGIYSTSFNVHLQEIISVLILDIAMGITTFNLYTFDTASVVFNKIHTEIQSLTLHAFSPAIIICPHDFLDYFTSVTQLTLYGATFDSSPTLSNYTRITEMNLYYIKLPKVATILPSMLGLPNLSMLSLYQTEGAQWYNLIPESFVNTRIDYLYLRGLGYFYSYQFANLTHLTTLYLSTFFNYFTFEVNALAGLDKLTYLAIEYLETNLQFVTSETFLNLTHFSLRYTSITTLDQAFFERQKMLISIDARDNPFHCGCEMAWVSYAATNLGWEINGTCNTPASLNGNSISNSFNYISCPTQSYHCFNDGLICPEGISCVNTEDSAYCDCEISEANCEDIDECSFDNCEHNCTNTIGSYHCSCLSGFTLQPTFSCEDVNECSNDICEHNCINTAGSYYCTCHPGYTLQPPHFCEDTDECSINSACEHNCMNIVGSYTCSCDSGFVLQSDMSSCVSGVSQLTAPIFLTLLSLLLQMSLL